MFNFFKKTQPAPKPTPTPTTLVSSAGVQFFCSSTDDQRSEIVAVELKVIPARHYQIRQQIGEKMGHVIGYDDAALIDKFIELQNITLDEFCEHYDDNIALARLTQ